jgi:DNA-binding SARP family transcriptional activator
MIMDTTAEVDLGVLGTFGFWVGGRSIHLPLQARRVLALLAVDAVAVPRATIAGRLWGECTISSAASKLRNALWHIRRTSGAAIVSRGDPLSLTDRVGVDLAEARACADRLRHEPARRLGCEVDLLSRDLLPDWDEDWLMVERERLKQVRMHALERLSASLRHDGLYAEAIEAALAAASVEPLRESAQIALIDAHLEEGNASEAIRQYESYRDLLRDELGIEPSERLRSMVHVTANR